MADRKAKDSIAEFNARSGLRPLPATTGLGVPPNPRAGIIDEVPPVPFSDGRRADFPPTQLLSLHLASTVLAPVPPPQFGCVDPCVPFINVEAFGADRTGNSWSTGAFVAARLAALQYRKIVFVPSGVYKITPGLEVGGVDWLGASVGTAYPTPGGTLATPSGPVSVSVNREYPTLVAGKTSNAPLAIASDPTNMRGLTFDASEMAPIALDIRKTVGFSTFERVRALNAEQYGIRIDGNVGASFRSCRAETCGTGFQFHLCNHVNCYDLTAKFCLGPGLEIVGHRSGELSAPPVPEDLAGIVNIWGFHVDGNGPWIGTPLPWEYSKHGGHNPAILLRGVGGGVLQGFNIELSKPSDGVVLTQNCHNVTLRQFRIAGNSPYGHRAVRLVDCRGCALQQFMLPLAPLGESFGFDRVAVEALDPGGANLLFNTVDALQDTPGNARRFDAATDFIGKGAKNIQIPSYVQPSTVLFGVILPV